MRRGEEEERAAGKKFNVGGSSVLAVLLLNLLLRTQEEPSSSPLVAHCKITLPDSINGHLRDVPANGRGHAPTPPGRRGRREGGWNGFLCGKKRNEKNHHDTINHDTIRCEGLRPSHNNRIEWGVCSSGGSG